MSLIRVRIVLIACLTILVSAMSHAYGQAPNLPASAQDVSPSVNPTDPRRRSLPETGPSAYEPITTPGYQGVEPANSDKIIFVLSDVSFSGAEAFAAPQLRRPYEPLIGKEVSLAQVYDATRTLQSDYRAEGYILTRVVVPAQTIDGGVIKVQVVEGYISQVLVKTDIGDVGLRVKRYLTRLTQKRPVRTRDIERYMLLVNDLPGLTASGVLRADPNKQGAAQLIVDLKLDATNQVLSVNNRGSRFTGPVALAYSIAVNSQTYWGERNQGFLYFTPEGRDGGVALAGSDAEQIFALLAHQSHFGGEGTRLNIEASYGISHPGYTLSPLEIENQVMRIKARVTHPVIRTRRHNLDVYAEFERLLERVQVGSINSESTDRMSILGLGLRYDFGDTLLAGRGARTEVEAAVRQGIPLFGITDQGPDRSRPEGRAKFTALKLRLVRDQALSLGGAFPRFQLYTAVEGQYSFQTLLSQSEFRIGGNEFGRAFDPSELAGEHGVGVSVELRYNGARVADTFKSYQAYAFYDWGFVKNTDSNFPDWESLSSAGVGVRTELRKKLLMELEYARVLSNALGSDPDIKNRFFARLTAQF